MAALTKFNPIYILSVVITKTIMIMKIRIMMVYFPLNITYYFEWNATSVFLLSV